MVDHSGLDPPGDIRPGQAWVTKIVNAVMRSPHWESSVPFLTWDDWGDFYDHVHPPGIDENGFIGIRVPGLAATGPAGREVRRGSVATLPAGPRPTVPSSSGLGHHPLKVETRVRTPLGLQVKPQVRRG